MGILRSDQFAGLAPLILNFWFQMSSPVASAGEVIAPRRTVAPNKNTGQV
ncbi:MAG TPA: hypothetical protein VFZ59_17435 [Verrucomicrobiae bacterium]|nr:hypothetical protein [Verrucomicrobiae bacterium]